MLKVYDRLSALCGSINQLNRLHVSLESSMTAIEVLELDRELVRNDDYWTSCDRANQVLDLDQFRATTRTWVTKLVGFHEMSGKPEPEAFHREELLPAVSRYRNVEGAEGKWLVICMCGTSPMPMMPTPSLMQALDSQSIDFVLVRDFHRNGYRSGIRDLSSSLDGALVALPRLVDAHDYAGLALIGLSGGGLPALLLALASGANSVISVGGNSPHDPRWIRSDGVTAVDLLRDFAAGGQLPRISLLYGEKSFDRPAAEAMAAILPATLHQITEPDYDVGHNAFFPLLRTGRMSHFLVEQLGLPT